MTDSVASTGTASSLALPDDPQDGGLPEIVVAADNGAKWSQRQHFFFVRFELICISLVAIAELFGHQFAPAIIQALHIHFGEVTVLGKQYSGDQVTTLVAGTIPAAFFMLVVVVMYLLRVILRRDRRWRERRALAEGVKSLAWLYGMHAMHDDLTGAVPLSLEQAHQAFLNELRSIEKERRDLHLAPPVKDAVQITTEMEDLRAASPARQEAAFKAGRVEGQRGWYTRKAKKYARWTLYLQVARGLTYAAGVALIVLNPLGFGGLSAVTTIAGAFAAWLAGKHYEDLSQDYGAMARKLGELWLVAPGVEALSQDRISAQRAVAAYARKVETLLESEHNKWLSSIR